MNYLSTNKKPGFRQLLPECFPLWILFLSLFIITGCIGQPQLESTPEVVNTASPTATTLPPTPTLPPFAPTVLSITPRQDSTVPLNSPFLLRFNQPMDVDSVEQGFSFAPDVGGTITWLDDSTMEFVPDIPLQMSGHYTITLANSIKSKLGTSAGAGQSFNFSTVGPLEITQFSPDNNAIDVDTSAAIWVAFNQPIVDLSHENNPEAFAISPEVPGIGRWAGESIYIFYPASPMLGSTQYTVQVNQSLTASSGAFFIQQPKNFEFSTTSPQLIGINPPQASELEGQPTISIQFNQAMSPESVESALSLVDSHGTATAVNTDWSQEDTLLLVTPVDDLTRGSTYTLAINTSAKSKGGISINDEILVYYATVPLLTVDELPNPSLEIRHDGYAELTFQFNLSLEPGQDFNGLIDIRPYTPDNLQAELSEDGKKLTYSGYFRPATFFSYAISPDLKDAWGKTLGSGIFKRFATTTPPTTLKIDALENDFPFLFIPIQDISIPAETTNIRRVDFQSAPISVEEFSMLADADQATRSAWQPTFDRTWHRIISPYLINAALPTELSLAPANQSLDPGLYYFTINSTEFKDDRPPIVLLAAVAQSHLAIKYNAGEMLIWAVDMVNNETISNAPIVLYDSNGQIINGGSTDARGILKLDKPQAYSEQSRFYIMMHQPGHPLFGFAMTDDQKMVVNESAQLMVPPATGMLLTDKPVYLPGENIKFEVLFSPDTISSLPELIEVQLALESQEGLLPIQSVYLEDIESASVRSNLQIPEGLPPGNYHLGVVTLPISRTIPIGTAFDTSALLSVEMDTSESLTFANPLTGAVFLRYPFGAPIADIPISWQASASLSNSGDTPGRTAEAGLQNFDPNATPKGGEFFLAAGTCFSDQYGKCDIDLPSLLADSRFNSSYTYSLILSATAEIDSADAMITTTRTIEIHPDNFLIEIIQEEWGGEAGVEQGFEIRTFDYAGNILTNIALEASFQHVSSRPEPVSVGGSLETLEVFDYLQVSSSSFSTDNNGYARLLFTPQQPGVYRVLVNGSVAASDLWLWVGGPGEAEWIPAGRNTIAISVDRKEYTNADTAQVLIPNPFVGTATALVTLETTDILREQVLTIEGSSDKLAIPLSDIPAPGAVLSVVIHGITKEGLPDVISGTAILRIKHADDSIDLNVVTTHKPEDSTVRLQITSNQADGNPQPANMTLIALPREWLYAVDHLSLVQAMPSNLHHGFDLSLPISDYARNMPNEGGKIDIYQESIQHLLPGIPELSKHDAIWISGFSTDENGLVYVEFPVNLLYQSYMVYIVAHTSSQTTQTEIEVPTSPEQIIQVHLPEFVRHGDQVGVTAEILAPQWINGSGSIEIAAEGFILDQPDQAEQILQLDSNGKQWVRWYGTVTGISEVTLTVTATSGSETSEAVGTIPVFTPTDTHVMEGVISSAATQMLQVNPMDANQDEEQTWELTLYPNLESYLVDRANSVIDQPIPPSASAMAAQLLVYASLKTKATELEWDIPAIDHYEEDQLPQTLEKLEEYQNPDGSWGNLPGLASDANLTAFIIYSLQELQQTTPNPSIPLMVEQGLLYLEITSPSPADLIPNDYESAAFIDLLRFRADSLPLYTDILLTDLESGSPATFAWLLQTLPDSMEMNDTRSQLETRLTESTVPGGYGVSWYPKLLTSADTISSYTAKVLLGYPATKPGEAYTGDIVKNILLADASEMLSHTQEAWILHAAIKVSQPIVTDYHYIAVVNNTTVLEGNAQNGISSPVSITLNDLEAMSTGGYWLTITRQKGTGDLYYLLRQSQPISISNAKHRNQAFSISRTYQYLGDDCRPGNCSEDQVFQMDSTELPIQVRLQITISEQVQHLFISDPLMPGASFSPPADVEWLFTTRSINPLQFGLSQDVFSSPFINKDSVEWYAVSLEPGTYILTYYIMPGNPGIFKLPPAQAWQEKKPGLAAASAVSTIEIQ
ncbi:MAG: Ig-like domain-containing protein [Anaerolineae bacterium]|nr:Ig-like domain-containing protein [Anaerolineae bacterium]